MDIKKKARPRKPPLTPEELVHEAVLWRLEGLWSEDVADVLGVSVLAVNEALKRSGAYVLTFRGRGKRKRIEIFCLTEVDRKRLDIPWRRVWGTCCDVLIPRGAVSTGNLYWNDPRVIIWQKEFHHGEVSGRGPGEAVKQHDAKLARASRA